MRDASQRIADALTDLGSSDRKATHLVLATPCAGAPAHSTSRRAGCRCVRPTEPTPLIAQYALDNAVTDARDLAEALPALRRGGGPGGERLRRSTWKTNCRRSTRRSAHGCGSCAPGPRHGRPRAAHRRRILAAEVASVLRVAVRTVGGMTASSARCRCPSACCYPGTRMSSHTCGPGASCAEEAVARSHGDRRRRGAAPGHASPA